MITRRLSSNSQLHIHNSIIPSTDILTQLSRLPAEIEILAQLVIQKRTYHHDEIKTEALGRGIVCRHPPSSSRGWRNKTPKYPWTIASSLLDSDSYL